MTLLIIVPKLLDEYQALINYTLSPGIQGFPQQSFYNSIFIPILYCSQTNYIQFVSPNLSIFIHKYSYFLEYPLLFLPIPFDIQILKSLLSLEAHFTTTFHKALMNCFGQKTHLLKELSIS